MITAVAQYEPSIAAAILSRAAFWLEDESNPASQAVLPNEDKVRNAVISEVKHAIGVSDEDISPQILERVGNELDKETDSLIGKTDVNAVLHRLALEGEVPSDLYQIQIIPNVKSIYEKHWAETEESIRETVKSAELEQHFGPHTGENKPKLISLFLKSFTNEFPFRSFKLLVAGQRDGLLLNVHQAWRIYADQISLEGASDLVEILRRFANRYGVEFSFDGVTTKFILHANRPIGGQNNIEILPQYKLDGKGRKVDRPMNISVSHFYTPSENETFSSLTTAIDLEKYGQTLVVHGW